MNSQSASVGMPGNGLVPLLHGVLATKTPRTDETPDVVV